MTRAAAPEYKRMKLRYAGTCRRCAAPVAVGEPAVYYRAAKQVECIGCFNRDPFSAPLSEPTLSNGVDLLTPEDVSANPSIAATAVAAASDVSSTKVEAGTAGASARSEYDRRVAKRQERVRSAHPKLGGLILALSDEPQSTQAWQRGAVGEEKLGRSLDKLKERGALLLHDRRIPGSRANIDHLVIGSPGVFVVDAKRYKGRPQLRVEGGILRPRVETLMVGRRDCSKLIAGIRKQVDLVKAALARLSVRGRAELERQAGGAEQLGPVGRGAYGGTQSQIRVSIDGRGQIHGTPFGPETP